MFRYFNSIHIFIVFLIISIYIKGFDCGKQLS